MSSLSTQDVFMLRDAETPVKHQEHYGETVCQALCAWLPFRQPKNLAASLSPLRFSFHLLQNSLITQFIHENKGMLCCMLQNAGSLAQFNKEGTFTFKGNDKKRKSQEVVKYLRTTTKTSFNLH